MLYLQQHFMQNVKKKNVNVIYNGYVLSYANTKLSQFTGMTLKQRKQIFQIYVT